MNRSFSFRSNREYVRSAGTDLYFETVFPGNSVESSVQMRRRSDASHFFDYRIHDLRANGSKRYLPAGLFHNQVCREREDLDFNHKDII